MSRPSESSDANWPSRGAEAGFQTYWQSNPSNCGGAPPLGEGVAAPEKSDLVVIGAGMAGLTVANAILDRDPSADVTVIDAHEPGFGASGRNGGLMSPIPAPIWLASSEQDSEHAWAVAHLHHRVADSAHWIAKTLPAAELERVSLQFNADGAVGGAVLTRLSEILNHTHIAHDFQRPRGGKRGALLMPAHAVHPMKLVQALVGHAKARGARIVTCAPVTSIVDFGQGVGVHLGAQDHRLMARKAIVCTNAYTSSLGISERLQARAVHNYMLVTRPLPRDLLRQLDQSGVFSVEFNKAYAFYRLHDDRIIFGGIEKMRPGTANDFEMPADVRAQLKDQMMRCLSPLAPGDNLIDYAWGGQYHQTWTDLPIIRPARGQPNILFNVGYGGTGVAQSLAFARIVTALVFDDNFEDRDDERLYRTLQSTRLKFRPFARQIGKIVRRAFSNWRTVSKG